MKRHSHVSVSSGILLISMLLCVSCEKKTFQSSEPTPTLEVTSMQNSYVIDQAAYLQIKISQQGYEGDYQLSTVLQEGGCSLTLKGSEIPTTGDWITMSSKSEILTLVPTQIGPLRISFEVKDKNGGQSGRSLINFSVAESPELKFEINAPTSSSISSPVTINLYITKAGWTGTIPVRFEQIAGSGVLQFGSLTIETGKDIAVPANSEQILYYTPSSRGIHKLQFSATDGYTTSQVAKEIIITQ